MRAWPIRPFTGRRATTSDQTSTQRCGLRSVSRSWGMLLVLGIMRLLESIEATRYCLCFSGFRPMARGAAARCVEEKTFRACLLRCGLGAKSSGGRRSQDKTLCLFLGISFLANAALLPWREKLRALAIRSRPTYLGHSAPMKHDTVSEFFGFVFGVMDLGHSAPKRHTPESP